MKMTRRWKQIAIMLLTLAVVVSGMGAATAKAEDMYVPDPPFMALDGSMPVVEAAPGQTVPVTVPIIIYNQSIRDPYFDFEMTDVPVTIDSDPVVTQFGNVITNYASGYLKVEFALKVKDTAQAGNYKMYLKLDGIADSSSEEVSMKLKTPIRLKVGQTKKAPDLDVIHVTNTEQVKAKESVDLSFDIQNSGELPAQDVKISIPELNTEGFIPNYESTDMEFSSIPGKSTEELYYNYTMSQYATAGLKVLTINVTWKDSDGKEYSSSSSAYVEVVEEKKEEPKPKGTPKLIISDFSVGEETLRAGNVFTFQFDVTNTHKSVAANNIKVTLSSAENVFSVTEGSNSFYIDTIKAGQVKHNELSLKVKNDCTTKAYPLSIKFQYEYDGMPTVENQVAAGVEVEEILNLQVQENSRPVVSNITVGTWETPKVNELTTISFDFYNMGKAVLSNVTARVVSDVFAPTGDMTYIGNVEAGTGNTYEVEVMPNMAGEGQGTLVLTYEDSNGEPVELETEFTGMVEEEMSFVDPGMDGMDGMDDMDGMESETAGWKKFLIPGAAVLFVIVVTAVIIMIKKKKKKAEEFDDEDE